MLFPGIIRRININALNSSSVLWQQRFQGKKVISLYYYIPIRFFRFVMKFFKLIQRMVWNGQVVVPDYIFTFKLKCRHGFSSIYGYDIIIPYFLFVNYYFPACRQWIAGLIVNKAGRLSLRRAYVVFIVFIAARGRQKCDKDRSIEGKRLALSTATLRA